GDGGVDKAPPVLEIAVGDELAFRVCGQPALTVPQQLLYLVVTDPIVLVVIKDGNQHVEVAKEVLETLATRQRQRPVGAGAPDRELLVQRIAPRGYRVAHRCKETAQHGLAA